MGILNFFLIPYFFETRFVYIRKGAVAYENLFCNLTINSKVLYMNVKMLKCRALVTGEQASGIFRND